MRVIIAGDRHFKKYRTLRDKCDKILANTSDVEVICLASSQRIDKLVTRYSEDNDLTRYDFPADWKTLGKAAFNIRNKEMVQFSDGLIAFWDGMDTDTGSLIDMAQLYGLRVRIVYYKGKPEVLRLIECKYCNGKGIQYPTLTRCTPCRGSGRVEQWNPNPRSGKKRKNRKTKL